MERDAPTDYEVIDLIRQRHSPRVFAPKRIEAEALRSLLEAARWAASCFNEQPWRFLVATQDEPSEYQQLLACLVEANQAWAKEAPVLMLSVASSRFAKNDKPNRHALHDVGLAVAQMTLQATAMGLVAHQMAGFDAEKARSTFEIPDGFDPVAAIALGYAPVLDALPPEVAERERAPRKRRPQRDFAFRGHWGKPF